MREFVPEFAPLSLLAVVLVAVWLFNSIKVLREYERGVIFRLGRLLPQPKGPGLILVFWPIDRMVRVSLRVVTLEVPPQDIITQDNVSVKVNAVVYFRVINAIRSIVEVENYLYATTQLAQTTLRSVLGQVVLDDLLSRRETLNLKLQEILDRHADPWGIKVALVEVSKWTCRRKCSGPWRSRRKPSARSEPRLSMQTGSFRHPRSWRKPRQLSPENRWLCSCATCRP